MQTTQKPTARKLKDWHPTKDQVEFIKAKYATYYSSGRTMTKTKLAKAMGVSRAVFERYCQKAGIKPREPKKHTEIDYSEYTRVPVPCKSNSITYLLVRPGKCPIEAKKRYMKKYRKSLKKKV